MVIDRSKHNKYVGKPTYQQTSTSQSTPTAGNTTVVYMGGGSSGGGGSLNTDQLNKLNSIEYGAQVNQNAYSYLKLSTTDKEGITKTVAQEARVVTDTANIIINGTSGVTVDITSTHSIDHVQVTSIGTNTSVWEFSYSKVETEIPPTTQEPEEGEGQQPSKPTIEVSYPLVMTWISGTRLRITDFDHIVLYSKGEIVNTYEQSQLAIANGSEGVDSITINQKDLYFDHVYFTITPTPTTGQELVTTNVCIFPVLVTVTGIYTISGEGQYWLLDEEHNAIYTKYNVYSMQEMSAYGYGQGTPGGAGGFLNDLEDVIITNVQKGDILQYNGTNWVNVDRDSVGNLKAENLKPGTNIKIEVNGEIITISNTYTLPVATSTTLGGIKVNIANDSTLGFPIFKIGSDGLFDITDQLKQRLAFLKDINDMFEWDKSASATDSTKWRIKAKRDLWSVGEVSAYGYDDGTFPKIDSLDDLNDVVITSATEGDILYYNGTTWINRSGDEIGTLNPDNIKAGTNISIEVNGKIVTINNTYKLPIASNDTLGGIKVSTANDPELQDPIFKTEEDGTLDFTDTFKDKLLFLLDLQDMFEWDKSESATDESLWRIKAKRSLWSVGEISAYGRDEDSSAPQGTEYLYLLKDVNNGNGTTPSQSGTLLMWNGTTWQYVDRDQVGLNETELNQYLTANGYLKSPINWSNINSTTLPTTLAGYGITDAYTKTEADDRYVNITGDTMTGNLILPAALASNYIQIGDARLMYDADHHAIYVKYKDDTQTANFYSEGEISAYGIRDEETPFGSQYLHELLDVNVDGVVDKDMLIYDADQELWITIAMSEVRPNLEEYLTEAEIRNEFYTKTQSDDRYVTIATDQTITGIKKFNKPIKLSVVVADYNQEGIEYRNSNTIVGAIGAVHDSDDIYYMQLNPNGILDGVGGLVIGDELGFNGHQVYHSGNITIPSEPDLTKYVQKHGDTMTGNLIVTNGSSRTTIGTAGYITLQGSSPYIRIGDIYLRYDASNNAIYTQHANTGRLANFYAQGEVSAYGMDSGSEPTGAQYLHELLDVDIQNAVNNDMLIYNASSETWVTISMSDVRPDLSEYLTEEEAKQLFYDKQTIDGRFVTITTDQIVSGTKTFTKPIKVNISTSNYNQQGLEYISSNSVIGCIGAVHDENSIYYMQINPKGELDGIGGLVVGEELGFNGYQVYHSGNTVIPSEPDLSKYVQKHGDTMTGNLIVTGGSSSVTVGINGYIELQGSSPYLRIGNIYLRYDSTNHALYTQYTDNSQSANFYAQGEISAYGIGDSSDVGGVEYLYELLDVNNGNKQNPTGTDKLLMWDGDTWAYIDKNEVGLNEQAIAEYLKDNHYVTTGTSSTSAGTSTRPIYINSEGVATQINYTIGANINSGVTGRFAYYSSNTTIDDYSNTVGSASRPMYLNQGVPTQCTYTFGNRSGNYAAINNGTLNSNLNADLLDGYHYTSFPLRVGGDLNVSSTRGDSIKLFSFTRGNEKGWIRFSVSDSNNSASGVYAKYIIGWDYTTSNPKSVFAQCIYSYRLNHSNKVNLVSTGDGSYDVYYTPENYASKTQCLVEGYAGTLSGINHTNSYANLADLDIYTTSASSYPLYGSFSGNLIGNASTATKWQTARTITLNGSVTGSVSIDGSQNVTITTTYATSNITALDDRYVNISGDTMTGTLTLSSVSGNWINGKTNAPIKVASTTKANQYYPYIHGADLAGNVWNLGLISEASTCGRVGFFGYYADRTTNDRDWWFDIRIDNGQLRHSSTMQVSGLITAISGLTTPQYLQVGNGRIYWDSTNNALYVKSSDGSSAINFYATGEVAAYGAGDTTSGSMDIDLMWDLLSRSTDEQINKTHLTDALSGYATQVWVEDYVYNNIPEITWSAITGKPSWLSSTVGSSNSPVYISNGTPIAITYDLNTSVNSGMSGRLAYYNSNSYIDDYSSSIGSSTRLWYLNTGVPTNSSTTVGSSSDPVYLSNGYITLCSQVNAYTLNDKTSNYYFTRFTRADISDNGTIDLNEYSDFGAFEIRTAEISIDNCPFSGYGILLNYRDGNSYSKAQFALSSGEQYWYRSQQNSTSTINTTWYRLARTTDNGATDTVYRSNQADRWTTSRTITLNGIITGSVSINGSSNVTISTSFSTRSVGSSNSPIYLNNGQFQPITYDLNATVNSGSSDKLAYYSSSTTVDDYTSTIGSSTKLWYLNSGIPTDSNANVGSYTSPVYLSNGVITACNIDDTYVNESGDTMTGALVMDYANSYDATDANYMRGTNGFIYVPYKSGNNSNSVQPILTWSNTGAESSYATSYFIGSHRSSTAEWGYLRLGMGVSPNDTGTASVLSYIDIYALAGKRGKVKIYGDLFVDGYIAASSEVTAYSDADGGSGSPGSVTVINDLTSTSTTAALSANMGRQLNENIQGVYATVQYLATTLQSNYYTKSEVNDLLDELSSSSSGLWSTITNGIRYNNVFITTSSVTGSYTTNGSLYMLSNSSNPYYALRYNGLNYYFQAVNGGLGAGLYIGPTQSTTSMYIDSSGNVTMPYDLTINGGIKFNKSHFYSLTDANILDERNAYIRTSYSPVSSSNRPSSNTCVNPFIVWGDCSTTGYATAYSISSIRRDTTSFGVMRLAVGQSRYDSSTSLLGYIDIRQGYVYVLGDIQLTGQVFANQSSDIRLKKNIQKIDGLDLIRKLQAYEFDWNDTALSLRSVKNKHDYGFIAQEIEQIFPEAVVHNMYNKDYLGIDYNKLIPFGFQAVKEIDEELTCLKNRVQVLEDKLSQYESIN